MRLNFGIMFLLLAAVSCSRQNTEEVVNVDMPPANVPPSGYGSPPPLPQHLPPPMAQRQSTANMSAGSYSEYEAPSTSQLAATNTAQTTPRQIAPLLAYSYAITLQLPKNQVETQMRGHQQACVQATINKCQVISSEIRNSDDAHFAKLSIRGEPVWLEQFRDNLVKSASDSGGRLITSTVTSEDLTREIIDASAALKSQTELRTKIQGLISSHRGNLGDLLEAQNQLAQAQSNIESMASNLAFSRARVAMSVLDLTYQSKVVPISNSAIEPLKNSFLGFFGLVSASLAKVINLIASFIPFGLLFGTIAWLALKRFSKYRIIFQRKSEIRDNTGGDQDK